MTTPRPGPIVHQWLSGPLPKDVRTALERLQRAPDVRRVAIMPDVHLAAKVCVGCVIATSELLYPEAVGGDIGCGMAAIRLECPAECLADPGVAGAVLADLYDAVPLNRQRRPVDLPEALGRPTDAQLIRAAERDGRVQLGTLGRGNHFLEFQADEAGGLWLMVHSGSRAMGQAITERHLAAADRVSGGLRALEAASPRGQTYLADVGWAMNYARESRRAMIQAATAVVRKRLGACSVADSFIECDHNHVRRERHFGQEYWVHRKGANSAHAGEPGLIPGSMGTCSYHVAGRGCPEALCSSSHGAGRAMSRDQARRTIHVRDLERQLRGVLFDRRRAGELCEEAPEAYKDIKAVMRAQHALTAVVRVLRPVLCYKGG